MSVRPSQRRRGLGLWMATALVIGNMVGSGVFLLPSSLAKYGGITVFAWVFTALGAMLLALVFARLGRTYPKTGGPAPTAAARSATSSAFRPAWGYWIAIWVGNAAIAVAFVSYLSTSWGALATNSLLAAGVAVAAIWLLTEVNVLGVRHGGWAQLLTTVLRLVPLLAIATIGLLFVKSGNFRPFNPSGQSDLHALTTAAALTLWAFIGLESATVPAEDVDHPERTIPRSTILGTLATALIYILGTVAVMGVLPVSVLAHSNAPFADAARQMFGGWAGDAVAIGAIVSAFGALNGWILLQGQIPLAAARDRLFPASFAKLTRNGTPWVGLVDQFTFIVLLATLTTLVPYAYSAAAQLMLLATDRARFSTRRLATDAIVALLAFGYTLWAIAGSGYEVVFKGFLLLLAGIPIYVWMRWRSSKAAEPATGNGKLPVPLRTTELELTKR